MHQLRYGFVLRIKLLPETESSLVCQGGNVGGKQDTVYSISARRRPSFSSSRFPQTWLRDGNPNLATGCSEHTSAHRL